MKTLAFGAALSVFAGFDFAGDSAAPSDLRGRFADRSLDAPFSLFAGALEASAFLFTAPMVVAWSSSKLAAAATVFIAPAKSSIKIKWGRHANAFGPGLVRMRHRKPLNTRAIRDALVG